MNIAIVYESSTGTTAKDAEATGKTLEENGHQCQVQSVGEADPAEVAEADLICVGAWVKGSIHYKTTPLRICSALQLDS